MPSKEHANSLESQLGEVTSSVGKSFTTQELDLFNSSQLEQLVELQKETLKAPKVNDTER